MSGEGILPQDGSFADHPLSLSEARADRSGQVSDLTPRDALISVLRELDAGRIDADHIIIAIGSTPKPGRSRTELYQGGSYRFHGQLGLVTHAADVLRARD